MPIKERRTKILLLLFLLPPEVFQSVELSDSVQEIFDLSLNQKTKGVLSSMIKNGEIEKSEENESTAYKLTDKGYDLLCLEFPFFRFLKEEWDGRWRIISYEIPESKREIRDRLRREMRGWGLGPWHRSFWLTPHPIIETLRDLVYGKEEEQYIQAFESTHVFGDLRNLVEKVWGKAELEKKYRELFKKWHTTLSSDQTKDNKFKSIIADYVELLRLDPGLPTGLIGSKWIGFEALNILKEIKTILLH
jgi:phenylacetic acid degradation operon negative regulatory protein